MPDHRPTGVSAGCLSTGLDAAASSGAVVACRYSGTLPLLFFLNFSPNSECCGATEGSRRPLVRREVGWQSGLVANRQAPSGTKALPSLANATWVYIAVCSPRSFLLLTGVIGDSANEGLSGNGAPSPLPCPLINTALPQSNKHQPPVSTANSAIRAAKKVALGNLLWGSFSPFEPPTGAFALLHAPLLMPSDRRRERDKAQGDAPGHAQCRCTRNSGQRGAAAAPEGRTWPTTAPTCSAHGSSRSAHGAFLLAGALAGACARALLGFALAVIGTWAFE